MTRNTTPPPQPENTSDASMPPEMRRLLGVGLFLAGFLVAAIFAFIIYPRQGMIEATVDVNGYGGLARFIRRGQGFSQNFGPTLRRAPLYPYFVATLLKLFRSNAEAGLPERLLYRPVFVANCILVGFNCVAVWTLGRKLFNSRVGLLAAMLCLICPMVMRYVGVVEVETLFSLLITLMALTGYNLYQNSTMVNSVLFAVVCALATLTKSIVLLFPVLFLATLYFINKKRQFQKVQNSSLESSTSTSSRTLSLRVSSTLVIAVFCLCLLPWSLRNYTVSSGRFWNISTNGPAEFLRGYLNAQPKFYLLRQDFGGSDPTRLSWEEEASGYEADFIRPYGLDFYGIERGLIRDPRLPDMSNLDFELRKEAIEGAEMKRKLLHEPGRFLHKFVAQLATFWYIVETRKKSLIVGAIALVTLSFAFYGWLRSRPIQPGVFVIAFTAGYFNIVYAVFLSFARYSMPLYPILLILAANGILHLLNARKRHGKA